MTNAIVQHLTPSTGWTQCGVEMLRGSTTRFQYTMLFSSNTEA